MSKKESYGLHNKLHSDLTSEDNVFEKLIKSMNRDIRQLQDQINLYVSVEFFNSNYNSRVCDNTRSKRSAPMYFSSIANEYNIKKPKRTDYKKK